VAALPRDALITVLKQNQANESVVDITPSKNILLKAGTSDYNLPCAVAELVDNSIQALRLADQSHRRIQVRLEKRGNDSDPLGPLYIWDNGCGMTFDELKRWATMGISQMDLPPNVAAQNAAAHAAARGANVAAAAAAAAADGDDGSGEAGNGDPRVDNSVVTGQISRFGVGAKRAAFFLGRRVKVSTKSARSAEVCETELSEEALNRYGEQEWKITVKQRPPKSNETDVSFTSIKIDQMNALPYKQADTDLVIKLLRRELGRIYYYYTHPHVGEFYSIRVGPDRLNANNDDMQTLYTKFGHNTEVFEYDMPIPQSFRPPSGAADEAAADDLRAGTTRVVAHARYFPFENDDETLPVPYEVLRHLRVPDNGEPVSSAQVPLVARKPGVEIYWNGRLIPDAHLSQLGFMTLGQINNTPLEEQWRNRVRVTAFLGSVFPVTHNKMHLVNETPIVNQLMEHTTRALTQQFRAWLLNCHRQLDQEVSPVGMRYERGRDVTMCDEVRRGDLSVTAGSKVVIKANPTRLGRVKEVFFRGTPERRTSEVMLVDRAVHARAPRGRDVARHQGQGGAQRRAVDQGAARAAGQAAEQNQVHRRRRLEREGAHRLDGCRRRRAAVGQRARARRHRQARLADRSPASSSSRCTSRCATSTATLWSTRAKRTPCTRRAASRSRTSAASSVPALTASTSGARTRAITFRCRATRTPSPSPLAP
jgi:hypothetical protein